MGKNVASIKANPFTDGEGTVSVRAMRVASSGATHLRNAGIGSSLLVVPTKGPRRSLRCTKPDHVGLTLALSPFRIDIVLRDSVAYPRISMRRAHPQQTMQGTTTHPRSLIS